MGTHRVSASRVGLAIGLLVLPLAVTGGAAAEEPAGGGEAFVLPGYLAKWRDQMPKNLQYRIRAKDGMPQVLIPAGEFTMGATPEQIESAYRLIVSVEEGATRESFAVAGPRKRVHVSAFWMDLHDVTVGQYKRFCAATGRAMSTPNWNWQNSYPVVNVTWDDAKAYCIWVGGRLPTEAEWEKAARGAREGQEYVWGNAWPPPAGSGNFADESLKRLGMDRPIIAGYEDGFECASPPGSFAPNGYGLFDMAGNVGQWCADFYAAGWYGKMPSRDPVNTTQSDGPLVRGGSFDIDEAGYLRVAHRFWCQFLYYFGIGFRAAGPGGGVP